MEKIDTTTLRLLETKTARTVIKAGGVTAATIEAGPIGFVVNFRLATGGSAMLADKLGKSVRHWRDLARAAAYLRELGIIRFVVDMEGWVR